MSNIKCREAAEKTFPVRVIRNLISKQMMAEMLTLVENGGHVDDWSRLDRVVVQMERLNGRSQNLTSTNTYIW